jgi:tripartite ATP-independent transporter DctM subunit
MLIIISIFLIIIALLGAPLFSVIVAAALAGFYAEGIDLSVIGIELYRIADTPLLLALPLFTFAGYLLSEGNTSKRLVNLSAAALGWMSGGLAIVAFIISAFFTAFTGASGITIVALGALLYPALKQGGYTDKFSLGLVTTSGSLGLLLPPSLPLILYGIIAQQLNTGHSISFTELFLAGLFPATLMIAALCIWTIYSTRHDNIERIPFSAAKLKRAVWEMRWELPLPAFVLGGIYSGFFAVSEAAAVTALYVLIIEVFVHKEINFHQLMKVMRESMVMVGGILLILAVSLALTNVFVDAELPMHLLNFIQRYVDSKLTFLILLNIFLLILGAFLDIFSALVIVVPLILPIALGYGIDPVHLGIIFLANMQIGYFTPPIGMNLFIASYRFNKPIAEIYHATIPFMFVLLATLLIITYVPELSLFLIRQG